MIRKWRISRAVWLGVAGVVLVAGCGSDDEALPFVSSPTFTPPATATATAAASATATATPTPEATIGPQVSYLGLARADGSVLEPTSVLADGTPVFVRYGGSGFFLVVEGRPGASGAPVGLETFREDLASLPDLQIVSSRPLGNGSAEVCDNTPPGGGVPAVEPADFSPTAEHIAAINDLACRFVDGEGRHRGLGPEDACTLFPTGEYEFVNRSSTVQYCALVSRFLEFPLGETVLTVRLRDVLGNPGPPARLVVRIEPPPTSLPTATPTPTVPAPPALGPEITFLGVARADGSLVEPLDVTADGAPIFVRRGGSGFTLVIEGKPGPSGAAVSPRTYQPDLITLPDLQIWSSRDLGNGSPEVCDLPEGPPLGTPRPGGGVPGAPEVDFSLTAENIARVNDFACRFRDGQNQPFGRLPGEGCVLFPSGDYGFASEESTVQFCAAVDASIAFPTGDTRVTVRLRDVDGNVGPVRSLVIRVQ
jgi:hypothetical protein